MSRCRRTSSVGAMLQELNWKSVASCRRDARLVLFYKIHYGLVAVKWHVESKYHSGPTRKEFILLLYSKRLELPPRRNCLCIPSHCMQQLQSVINAAARLIFSSSRYNHITPLLHQLHWLKAPQRIEFKLTVLVFKCLHGSAPSYLVDELQRPADLATRRRLHSASSSSLTVLRTRLSVVGDRSFPVATARVWNGLPQHVTSAPSLDTFRSRLKTHLFTRSYDA